MSSIEELSFRIDDFDKHVEYEIFRQMDDKLASINNDVMSMQAILQAIAMDLDIENLPGSAIDQES